MKSLILMAVVGAGLFGASYAASSFLLVKKGGEQASATDDHGAASGGHGADSHGSAQPAAKHGEKKKEPASGSHGAAKTDSHAAKPAPKRKEPAATSHATSSHDSQSGSNERGFSAVAKTEEARSSSAAGEKVDAMPVSLQPDQPLSIEAVLQLSSSIQKKEALLMEREKVIVRDEQRIKLLFDDVQLEQERLESIGSNLDSRILAAREVLAQIQAERQGLAAEQASAGPGSSKPVGTPNSPENGIDPRVSAIKGIFSSLAPDQAAKYVKDFANRGDLRLAAQLLGTLDKKNQSKVLEAINDTTLGTQLLDAMAQ